MLIHHFCFCLFGLMTQNRGGWVGGNDDVIKWKRFPRYWHFARGIHRSPVNFPHKGQWREVLMSSMIRAWINGWVNNREAGDLRRHRAHYDVIVMGKISLEMLKISILDVCLKIINHRNYNRTPRGQWINLFLVQTGPPVVTYGWYQTTLYIALQGVGLNKGRNIIAGFKQECQCSEKWFVFLNFMTL